MTRSRPTLSVCILARSSRGGLERLLDEIDPFADEIVIGVDAASNDNTLAIAARRADVAFQFEHTGPPVRWRLPILERARGDWILSVDEDEGLDAAFEPLLTELISQSRYSHYWLPRKWIVGRQPLTYLHDVPWFPDWQLRLFRNDLRRVWHPGLVHSGYRVMGAACREDRTSILHYEPVTLGPAERLAKIEYYRRHGSDSRSDAFYRSTDGAERRVVTPGPATASQRRPPDRARQLHSEVVAALPTASVPPWNASLEVHMIGEATAGCTLLVEVNAKNTGRLAWEPIGDWPHVYLSYHLKTRDGEMARFDGERFSLPRTVDPGESARFLVGLRVPSEPGDWVVEWDLVSEGECWFAERGGHTATAALHVTGGHA